MKPYELFPGPYTGTLCLVDFPRYRPDNPKWGILERNPGCGFRPLAVLFTRIERPPDIALDQQSK